MIVGENAGLLMSTEQWRASESEERATPQAGREEQTVSILEVSTDQFVVANGIRLHYVDWSDETDDWQYDR